MRLAPGGFGLAIATPNLARAIALPFLAAKAERFGSRPAIVSGAILRTVALALSIMPWQRVFTVFAGIAFFIHQARWLHRRLAGGWTYDPCGDRTALCWAGVGIGTLSAVVHLAVRATPLKDRARRPSPPLEARAPDQPLVTASRM
jgi:MFS family permease